MCNVLGVMWAYPDIVGLQTEYSCIHFQSTSCTNLPDSSPNPVWDIHYVLYIVITMKFL